MPGSDPESAVEISDSLMERMGSGLMSGDFEEFASCFRLPHQVETFEGRRVIETTRDLQAVFHAVRTYCRVKGVSQLVRRCLAAEFKGPDAISATHEIRLLSGAQMVQKPFPTYSTLQRVDGRWQIVSCIYAIEDAPELNKALSKSVSD